MRRTAPQLLAAVAVAALLTVTTGAQVTSRPTPAPLVTADNESWYLEGDPITFAGNIYYQTGPKIFFNPFEMVRSGEFRGIPLYSKTTIEPFSKVFLPLEGHVMQPYERRRSGDLAGTVGSSAPSFPVVNPAEEILYPSDVGVIQAPSPPTIYTPLVGYETPAAADTQPQVPVEPSATAGAFYPRGPLVSARLPQGLNSLFVEYGDRRWFSSGPPVTLDTTRFRRIGGLDGFPVYERDSDENTIYISVSLQAETLLAPYSLRR
jgi:hypothetical protein